MKFRQSIALVGGAVVPDQRYGRIARHAEAALIEQAKRRLRRRIAVLGHGEHAVGARAAFSYRAVGAGNGAEYDQRRQRRAESWRQADGAPTPYMAA